MVALNSQYHLMVGGGGGGGGREGGNSGESDEWSTE